MKKRAGKDTLALVLLSGGIDSLVALYWAIKKRYKIQILTFNYFHRSRNEGQATRAIGTLTKLPLQEITLRFLKEIEDSKVKNRLLKSAEGSYIPSRNIIFYGIASSFAELADAKYIISGHNKDDVRNFPDSSIAFFQHFDSLTRIGLFSGDRTGRIILPLAHLTKVEVIKMGARLHVPFEATWSCYRSSKSPCGQCHSCKLRASAFKKAGFKDPLLKEK
jgi:7-cyano-7-deazaguanine synthase